MRREGGFTLIEMMITLALLATLASASIPLMKRHHQRQNEEELRMALRDIRGAIDRFARLSDEGRIEHEVGSSSFPEALSQLTEGIKDKSASDGRKIYLLRRLPRDPFCDCPGNSNEETWLIRSSTQPAGEQAGGKDVWDVRSRSAATGLNGVPYAQW